MTPFLLLGPSNLICTNYEVSIYNRSEDINWL